MRIRTVVAMLIGTGGCAATAPTPSPLVLTTDATQYSLGGLGGVALVKIVAQNTGTETLYTEAHYCGLAIETKLSNGSWSTPTQLCGSNVASLAIVPGGQQRDSVFLSDTGTHRATLLYTPDSAQAATKQSASNTFVISQQ